MCHYIVHGFAHDAPVDEIDEVLRPLGRKLWPYNQVVLPEPFSSYCSTRHFCDCGTFLGAGARAHVETRNPEEQTEALRRKGWSDARIGRWLAEKRAAVARREESSRSGRAEWLEDAEPWVEILRQIHALNPRRPIALAVHWTDHPSHLVNVQQVAVDRLSAETLVDLPEEHVLVLAAASR